MRKFIFRHFSVKWHYYAPYSMPLLDATDKKQKKQKKNFQWINILICLSGFLKWMKHNCGLGFTNAKKDHAYPYTYINV